MPIRKTTRSIILTGAIAAMTAASPAFGATAPRPPDVAPLASCTAPAVAQTFLSFGDANWYALAPGGFFSAPGNWQFSGGSRIVSTVQQDGTTGRVF